MATKQEDLDAVREIISGGAQTVTFKGNTVQYRSLSDLLYLEGKLEDEIAEEAGQPKSRLVYLNGSKGIR